MSGTIIPQIPQPVVLVLAQIEDHEIEQSRKRLPVALFQTPHLMCGSAHRIGSIVESGKKKAIYRVKVLWGNRQRKKYVTLTNIFVLENNIFVRYHPS